MAEIAALGIAGAGAAAGGFAGGKVMDGLQGDAIDARMPAGVSTTTIGATDGKDGSPGTTIYTSDISQSLEWFKKAASEQIYASQIGLTMYNRAMVQARQDVNAGYMNAINTLKPASEAGRRALDEMTRFMGIDPISHSANDLAYAKSIGVSADIQKQLVAAEKLRDPTQRITARDNILNAIEAQRPRTAERLAALQAQTMPNFMAGEEQNMANLQYAAKQRQAEINLLPGAPGYSNIYQQQIDQKYQAVSAAQVAWEANKKAQIAALAPDPTTVEAIIAALPAKPMFSDPALEAQIRQDQTQKGKTSWSGEFGNTYLAKVKAEYAKQEEAWDKARAGQIDNIRHSASLAGSKDEQLRQFALQFQQNYGDNYDAGYTGSQVAEKLKATPGYDWKMTQGLEAVNRTAAAKGMLVSGNTLAAANDYAQNQALDYFNSHMQNLNLIAQQGSGASNTIAQLQANQGTALGNLSQASGQFQYQANKDMGDATANAYNKSADLYAQNAQFNTSAINSIINKKEESAHANLNQALATALAAASSTSKSAASAGGSAGFASGASGGSKSV